MQNDFRSHEVGEAHHFIYLFFGENVVKIFCVYNIIVPFDGSLFNEFKIHVDSLRFETEDF